MEISVVSVLVVGALCAVTALLSNLGVAVFNDGVRPFVPEFLEGRMPRPEYALAVFGMCIGFIASVGIGNALATNLLNPWLLFLATDIIGAVSPNKIVAAIVGAAWGVLCLVGIGGINTVLTFLPVDLIGALGQLGTYIVTGFALFPVVAIIMQFGWQRGVITAVLALIARVLGPMWKFGPSKASISADAWTLLVGVVLLVAFAIAKDLADKDRASDELGGNLFSERVGRIRKNVPFLMVGAALIGAACNLHIFAGSTVSMFNLADAYKAAGGVDMSLVQTAAINELRHGHLRGVGPHVRLPQRRHHHGRLCEQPDTRLRHRGGHLLHQRGHGPQDYAHGHRPRVRGWHRHHPQPALRGWPRCPCRIAIGT